MNQPPENDPLQDDSTHTISWVSYILHLIVAVSAVIPGAQMGPALLVVALIIDLVKKAIPLAGRPRISVTASAP